MNKVKITKEGLERVQYYKNNKYPRSLNYVLERGFTERSGSAVINVMTDDQIAAAWLGADHCEIEPEYEELDHVQAAMAYAKGDKVWFQVLGQSNEWLSFNHCTNPEVLQQSHRKFRRQKP